MIHRVYISSVIGDGLTRQTAHRAALASLVPIDGTGQGWADIINDARPIRIGIAACPAATHTQIVGDGLGTALSPAFEPEEYAAWLAGGFGATEKTLLKNNGFPIAAETLSGDILAIVLRFCRATQTAFRQRHADMLAVMADNATRPLSDFPAGKRQRVRDFAEERGVDLSSLTGSSTVGDLLRLLTVGTSWGTTRFGGANFG